MGDGWSGVSEGDYLQQGLPACPATLPLWIGTHFLSFHFKWSRLIIWIGIVCHRLLSGHQNLVLPLCPHLDCISSLSCSHVWSCDQVLPSYTTYMALLSGKLTWRHPFGSSWKPLVEGGKTSSSLGLRADMKDGLLLTQSSISPITGGRNNSITSKPMYNLGLTCYSSKHYPNPLRWQRELKQ